MPLREQWTDIEIFCITNFYNKIDIEVLSAAIGRTAGAIRWKAADLGLQKPLQRLTTDQKKYINSNRNKMTHQAIADNLGIKRNSVTKYLSILDKKPR